VIRPAPPKSGRRRTRGEEGDIEVFVADEQSAQPVEVERWESLARNVLQDEGVTGDVELALLFVDEPTIAELNQRFMGHEGPTDVLAFPIDDDDVMIGRSPDGSSSGPDRGPVDDVPLLLGDVVICPAVAARNAPSHAGTYDDEIALLIVHGILHVLGHDHAEPDETQVMQSRERELLEKFHRKAS
jgi:probable rRNA maturation factor